MEFSISKTSDQYCFDLGGHYSKNIPKPVEKAFQVQDADGRYFWHINIESIQNLLDIIEESGWPIIIESNDWEDKGFPYIEIYDDYRE